MQISGIIARHNGKDFLEEVHGLCKLTLLRLPDSSAEFFHGFPVLIRRRVPEFNVDHIAIDGNIHDLRNYAVKFPDAVNRVLPGVLGGIETFSGGDDDVCLNGIDIFISCAFNESYFNCNFPQLIYFISALWENDKFQLSA